jgi:hypothetical protein
MRCCSACRIRLAVNWSGERLRYHLRWRSRLELGAFTESVSVAGSAMLIATVSNTSDNPKGVMKAEQFKEGGLSYTVRHLSKEEFEKEFPDSDEQINPETDLDNDPEINPETEAGSDKETSARLADVLRRVANNQSKHSMRDLSRMEVSERNANQPAPAPEASRTPNETSEALAKVIQRLRDSA